MTLADFLLARIAEDEAVARAASHDGERWTTPLVYGPIVAIDDGTEFGGRAVVYDEGCPSTKQAEHIARHDPARVLAECEAKRRIVERHVGGYPDDCSYFDTDRCPDLRDLALQYADHPDYDESWRP